MLPDQLSLEKARGNTICDHYMLVAAEKAVHTNFSVDNQIFAHNFHRQDFLITQFGLRPSLPKSPTINPVIHQAIYTDQKRDNIHCRGLLFEVEPGNPIPIEVSILCQGTKKLAHQVN